MINRATPHRRRLASSTTDRARMETSISLSAKTTAGERRDKELLAQAISRPPAPGDGVGLIPSEGRAFENLEHTPERAARYFKISERGVRPFSEASGNNIVG